MTKRSLLFSTLLIAAFCVAALAADFNGVWTAAIDTQVGVQNYTFTFKVTGEKLTGKAKSEFAMTETELRVMAAPAIIGLKSSPKTG